MRVSVAGGEQYHRDVAISPKVLSALGFVGFAVLLVGAGVGVMYLVSWDERHSPVVVVPPPQGGSVEIDGDVRCRDLPAWTDEASVRPCSATLTVGQHVVVMRDPGGKELSRDVVKVFKGSDYVLSHELPAGECLVVESTTYSDGPTIIGSFPREPGRVATGLVAVGGRLEERFTEPPKEIISRGKLESHYALRLRPCSR
jgi:hypothetical protein